MSTLLDQINKHNRSFIGLKDDPLYRFMAGKFDNCPTYPPYDVIADTKDEGKYTISVAVAGFSKDELEVTIDNNRLTVTGNKNADGEVEPSTTFLHKGIAQRSFELPFTVGEYIEIKDASLQDGILSINLVKNVPEKLKAKKITIK